MTKITSILMSEKDYCLQACQGIEYLHLNNVIHSDIKPANLLVSGTNDRITVKVTDFNDIAKFKQNCQYRNWIWIKR